MNHQRPIVLYIAASLDGYIAREGGGLDWLPPIESDEDFGYGAFFASVDTILMGSTTYEAVKAMPGGFPYAGKECYVFSRQHAGRRDSYVQFVDEDPDLFVAGLRERPGAKIWLMGGSQLLAAFLRYRLVDEFIIAVIPVLLGNGIPLFRGGSAETPLRLVGVEQFGQVPLLHYVKT